MNKLLIGIIVCLFSSGCMFFVPCPSSPSGYSHCGCLPPGITMYYQNESQQQQETEEQEQNGDIRVPSDNHMNF